MKKPKLKLTSSDGNAFFILGRAIQSAKDAGWTKEQIATFTKEAKSGDYDQLLQVCEKYFNVC